MTLKITPVAVLKDNYVWIIHDVVSGARAIVDPGDAAPVLEALQGNTLDFILLTHHHDDHIGGAATIRMKTGARIVGSASEAQRLPSLDIAVREGDTFDLGKQSCFVLETPGHVLGHLSFYFPGHPALFTGDTLFSIGCGRLFEGTPGMMFKSLRKFAPLPDHCEVFCGHEYTMSNISFAQTLPARSIALEDYATNVRAMRATGQPSLPTTLKVERALNPFLKAESVEAFARLRAAKDQC